MCREPAVLFRNLGARLRRVVRFDFVALILHDPTRNTMRLYHLDSAAPGPHFESHIEEGPAGLVFETQRPWLHPDIEHEPRFPRALDFLRQHGVRAVCALPLTVANRRVGVLGFGKRTPYGALETELEFLGLVAGQVAVAVDHVFAYQQVNELNEKLIRERLYLEEEIRAEYDCAGIVGENPAWKRAMRDVETVAPTDSTVLIRGEAGTGRELLARAIHSLSRRRERIFVKVDCASENLETCLFGQEGDGVPTVTGRFEMANQGTLFLDEIGSIPLDLQPKLLKVLQDREFHPAGSSRTVPVDVRLVTATAFDLGRMVAAREFRSDLFYRVNVFPVVLPALRDRREDIPLLVDHFARRFARRANRRIDTIPEQTVRALASWTWPGNVRELANVVERAVMLSPGPELRIAPVEPWLPAAEAESGRLGTMEEAEREHILRALELSRWVVGGAQGAAARLGMKRTTLQSRMQKLGISRPVAAGASASS